MDPMQQYAQVLGKSQSTVKDERQQAEAVLRQMMGSDGFGVMALKFLQMDQAAPALRQNLVKNHWDTVPDSNKAQIRAIIVPFLLSGPPPALRPLLGEAVSLLAQHDFPQSWPSLVNDLVSQANPQDYAKLVDVLRTAHSVFRRYRNVSASTDVLKELKFILEQFQKPLLQIYVQTWALMQQGGQSDPARLVLYLNVLNLCTKLFYDLNYVDLPEFFEDHMKEWMTGFLQTIKFKTTIAQALGDDEDKPGILHKVQKNVCLALTLYSTKYDEEFASYLNDFVQGVWQLLTESLATKSPKYESIVAHGVAFLTAVANGAHHRLFANGDIMKSICEKIVIPCMMLREEDVELFEDDPLEYVRQDVEGSDLDTRRRSAKELVKGLRKNYEEPVTQIFGAYIQILLKEYAGNPKGNWKAKDVAVFLLTAVAVSTFRQATGANSVNPTVPLLPFYKDHVLPDLLNDGTHPVLQADALKFVITFRSQIPPSEYQTLMPALAKKLGSPTWVIHSYAANALDNLLTIKDAVGGKRVDRISKEALAGMLGPLLSGLFGVFARNGQKPNSYVMRAIMRVISRSKELLGPKMKETLDGLSGMLRAVIANQQSPVFNHYLFESLGALIGCAAAAGGVAAISTLEQAMLPMFQAILQQDIQEFSGYVFQLMAQLIHAHQEGVPDVFWSIFPSLLQPILWDRPGNVPALVRLLSEYIEKGAAKIAAQEAWMQSLLGVWQHLNSAPKHDGVTFDLLRALCDKMPLDVLDKFLPRIIGFVFARLSAPKGKTPRYVTGFTMWICAFAHRHGGSAIMARCNSVQPGIWVNVINLIGQSINKPRSTADKKRCAMGTVKLLTGTDEMMVEPQRAAWGPLLLGLMGLFELPEEDEPEGLADEEITGGAVFTPLYHAGTLTESDPYPGVNPKFELASGLAALNRKTQGQVGQMIGQALPKAAADMLQSYFQAAKVSL